MSTFLKPKVVRIRNYVRRRFGKMEHVCQHWRSLPS